MREFASFSKFADFMGFEIDLTKYYNQARKNITTSLMDDVAGQIQDTPQLSKKYNPLVRDEANRILNAQYNFPTENKM